MPTSLSSDQVETYRQQGIVHPLRALPAAEAAALHARYQAQADFIKGRNNQKPHLLFTWLDALVRDARIVDAVESLLGPDLFCWGAQFFAKPAGDAAYVSWHQDATYWGLSSPDVATAWVALTPSTPESGCMQVVPGTHRSQVPHEDRFDDANLLSRGQEVAVEGRSGDGRRRRAAARRDVAASRAALPRLGAEPLAAAADRLRHPLRADARAPALADPRQRAAGARQRRVRPLRARAVARERPPPRCRGAPRRRHRPPAAHPLRRRAGARQAQPGGDVRASRRRHEVHSIRPGRARHRGSGDAPPRRRSRSASRIRSRRPSRRTRRPSSSPRTSPRAPTAASRSPSSRPSSSAPARTSTR